jgi:TRAP-type C4-dicarboxylate transport system substrate-binding protein
VTRIVLLFALALSASALADPPIKIRMAAAAPEGTLWAREFHSIDRDIQAATNGQVQMKWYLGGITGNESATFDRTQRGQIDGQAGALFCDRLAPSIRVARIAGLFQNRDEWHHVTSRLLPRIDAEAARNGFANLGIGSFGRLTIFSRRPIRTEADLRSQRFWTYDLDDVTTTILHHMDVNILPANVETALKAYDEGRVDGFITTPSIALAFQWSARSSYYSDLPLGELPGCFVIAQRALDPLSLRERAVVTAAVSHFVGRFETLGAMQDDALLALFERQGVHRAVADPSLRSLWMAGTRGARDKLGPTLVPPQLLTDTMAWLADYRSEHTPTPPPTTQPPIASSPLPVASSPPRR